MKKNTEKSNEQHLREILTSIKGLLPKEGEEAMEFFDALCTEITDKDDELSPLTVKFIELEHKEEEDDDEPSYDNTEDLGLDTFHWSLEGGNIILQGLVDDFVTSVKKKYAMVAS
jgi:hypothetical protein